MDGDYNSMTLIRAILSSIILLLIATVTEGAITQVQTIGDGTGVSSSFSKAFSSNVTAGNFIIVNVHTKNQAPNTPTDTLTNTYNLAACTHETSQARYSCIFYSMNIAGGADTVTVTQSPADEIDVRLIEYSGMATASALDQTATGTSTPGSGASTTPATSNTPTTCQASELLVSITSGGSQTYTAGTGYTLVGSASEAGSRSEDQIVSSTGAYSGTMTLAASTDWSIVLATFRAAGGSCAAPATATGNKRKKLEEL